ncbi:MAG: tRNA (adenosine(37)-N6)-threonylcarbamoyltransferase complex transferase subunit TsaD [Vicinamibacterales bacterium]
MRMLGIESSCDETAAAIVEETGEPARPWVVRSSVIASQVEIHREWGGVVPELASRQHLRDICGVIERALADASIGWSAIDAVAATQGPGLVGSLLVGLSAAKAIAATLDRPLVAVNHLAGHIESLVLHNGEMPLPAVVLVVSGGHTSLYHVPEPGRYDLLGRTRDDAAGEAYDKVAKLLGLGYPGGPILDKLASGGNDRAVDFPSARMTHADRNPATPPAALPAGFERSLRYRAEFSFSGVKTSVMRHVTRVRAERGLSEDGAARVLDEQACADIAASFQRAVVTTLVERTFDAARFMSARSVGIAGGVSANSRLRADAAARAARVGLPLFLPTLHLATDNAAMIAAAGFRRWRAGQVDALGINAVANLALDVEPPGASAT